MCGYQEKGWNNFDTLSFCIVDTQYVCSFPLKSFFWFYVYIIHLAIKATSYKTCFIILNETKNMYLLCSFHLKLLARIKYVNIILGHAYGTYCQFLFFIVCLYHKYEIQNVHKSYSMFVQLSSV